MRPETHAQPFPKLILLGTLELGLAPLRPAAKFTGALLIAVAVIGVPAWLIQLVISLAGGGNGGRALPPWAMVLLLGAAAPAGKLVLRASRVPIPWLCVEADTHTQTTDGYADSAGWDLPREDEPETEPARPADPAPLTWAYEALQLAPNATPAEVKAAYRRLAHTYHPDHNPGFSHQAAERFAAINNAYEALRAWPRA